MSADGEETALADLDEQLVQAHARSRAGEHAEAARLCREILATGAATVDALRLLAASSHAFGALDEAVAALDEALLVEPRDFRLHHQLGVILAQQGSTDAAVARFRQALRLQPDAIDVSIILQFTLAAQECGRALAFARQGNVDEAARCFRRALDLEPDYVDAIKNLGALLCDQGKTDEGVDCFRRVVTLKPDSAEAYFNLGIALARGGQWDAAIVNHRRALELNPDHAEAHNNLAAALYQQNHLDEAVAGYSRALKLKPDFTDAYVNLARARVKRNELDEAVACYRRLLQLKPHLVDARHSLAVALVEQNKLDEAAACYAEILKLKPGHVSARIGQATAMLLRGRFAEGWPEYQWRLKHASMPPWAVEPLQWTGGMLDGGTILLRSEQGFGDAIQFIRYAALVKQLVGTLVVESPPALARLLATCAGVDAVVVSGQPLPQFDAQAPMLSLPGIFRTSLETIPSQVPYLWPDGESVSRWRHEFSDERALRIGIAWQGNPIHPKDHTRSIPLERFAGIARLPGVRLYSLQFGAGREQLEAAAGAWSIVDLGDRLGDFHNTAAIVANLDLVITCDSVQAHLAGALGVNAWVALPFAPDWRWMLDRSDSPWYPTLRLFRQSQRGDWLGVFRRIEAELSKRLACRD